MGRFNMSKIPTERLRVVITGIVTASAEKKRKFLETIELQAVLKNYDVNKDKKKVKKLANKYDAFLASQAIMKQIPRLLGPTMHKLGKFPTLLERTESITDKIDDIRRNVKFQLKKVLTIGVAVANVELSEQQIYANVQIAVNFLVSLL